MVVLSFRNIQILYNTQLRNISLYLSIGLALLGYSRYYRESNLIDIKNIYDLVFIIISILFMYIGLYIGIKTKEDHILYIKNLNNDEKKIHKKWLFLIDIIKLLICIIILFTCITLLRQINLYK